MRKLIINAQNLKKWILFVLNETINDALGSNMSVFM